MKTMTTAAAACLAGAAGAAARQTAFYSLEFSSPDAMSGNHTSHILVPPGTVVSARVRVWFSPGIGAMMLAGGHWGTVGGLQDGAFTISGSAPRGTPGWTPSPHPPGTLLVTPYAAFLTSSGMAAGASHNGVEWGLGFLLSYMHPMPENPGTVWSNTFTTGPEGLIQFSFTDLSSVTMFTYWSTCWCPWFSFPALGLPASITVSSCYADCDLNGTLTVADFGCFQAAFVVGHPDGDCNGDGALTIADFGCFQTAFVAGCP